MLKVLKSGFAAIIAVIAITATIAAQAGIFESKVANAAVPEGCYVSFTTTGQPTPPTYESDGFAEYLSPIALQGSDVGQSPVTNPAGICNAENQLCCYVVDDLNRIVAVYFGEQE